MEKNTFAACALLLSCLTAPANDAEIVRKQCIEQFTCDTVVGRHLDTMRTDGTWADVDSAGQRPKMVVLKGGMRKLLIAANSAVKNAEI
ncbi:hypothetical protein PDESU_02290 [Pontiella desulfatans]|uniref:Uncharacterized protein n=1 Tax=Pontiella desulfatans TaxID=2750659 RepID=A0A6C2U1H7_PONDE|nr:hypothetical protein [Pontiella desulfatans]VGO13733.1 hypothetical protein PDESU_02290 [Pontiella desulfatans]